MPERDVLELVERCYAAVAEPDGWGEFLSAAAQAFDATAVFVSTVEPHEERAIWRTVHGLSQDEVADQNRWYTRNPRLDLTRRLIGPGQAFSFDQTHDVDSFKRSAYYVEHLSRTGLLWALIAWLDGGRDITGGLTLHRPERAPCFDAKDVDDAARLGRHIGRARQLQLDLERAHAETALQRGLLDRLPIGLVLLGGDGGGAGNDPGGPGDP